MEIFDLSKLEELFKNNPDKDVHKLTATQMFDIPYEEVTIEQRIMAKIIDFDILYGMSNAKLTIGEIEMKNEKKYRIPPLGGWKAHTFYLVEVSYGTGNPIHRDIFHTGFIDKGEPQNYNYLFAQGNCCNYKDPFYLKALKVLCTEKEFKDTSCRFCHYDGEVTEKL